MNLERNSSSVWSFSINCYIQCREWMIHVWNHFRKTRANKLLNRVLLVAPSFFGKPHKFSWLFNSFLWKLVKEKQKGKHSKLLYCCTFHMGNMELHCFIQAFHNLKSHVVNHMIWIADLSNWIRFVILTKVPFWVAVS